MTNQQAAVFQICHLLGLLRLSRQQKIGHSDTRSTMPLIVRNEANNSTLRHRCE